MGFPLLRSVFARYWTIERSLTEYICALLAMSGALVASYFARPISHQVPFLFVASTIVIIALMTGLGPCVIAAVAGAVGMYPIFHPPFFSLVVFVGVSTILGAVSHSRRVTDETMRRQALIFSNLADALLITDLEGKITDINTAAEGMYGYTKEEILGSLIAKLYRPEDVPSVCDEIVKTISNHGIWKGEVTFVRKDGSEGVSETTVVPFQDDRGRMIGRAGINREITDRKLLEQQLLQSQKMEAIGRLAGGIAHDFNNLLTAILGYTQLLLARTDYNDTRRRGLEEIEKAGIRAAGLTGQLLAFSRKQMLQPRILNLNEVLSEVEDMLRRVIGEDIYLVTHLDPGLGRVKADLTQIQQVIINLAVNARDAMPSGGVLTIETANTVPGAEPAAGGRSGSRKIFTHAALVVQDTGVGMDQETRSQIFEPFFTTKEPGKGTGMGLSTVYGIVKQSGGEINVTSQQGLGTRFEIMFPLIELGPRDPSHDRAEGLAKAAFLSGTPGKNGRKSPQETVLVVEDDGSVRELVRETLGEAGYKVLQAPNGLEAVALAQVFKGPIDLVVADLILPGINGYETARRLARLRPESRFLFVSGYTDDAMTAHRVLDSGAPFIGKPFTPSELATAVRKALQGPHRESEVPA
jgi:two-component system cell cycle sensor histidine kinase/response regulator CckA